MGEMRVNVAAMSKFGALASTAIFAPLFPARAAAFFLGKSRQSEETDKGKEECKDLDENICIKCRELSL